MFSVKSFTTYLKFPFIPSVKTKRNVCPRFECFFVSSPCWIEYKPSKMWRWLICSAQIVGKEHRIHVVSTIPFGKFVFLYCRGLLLFLLRGKPVSHITGRITY